MHDKPVSLVTGANQDGRAAIPAPIRVALETDGPMGTFTGPDGPLPW